MATIALAAIVPFPAVAQTDTLAAPNGQWVQMFAPDVERALGRSIGVDQASIVTTGTVRSFRQAEMLLRGDGAYPRGTTFYSLLSVDCQSGYQQTGKWSAVGADGALLNSNSGSQPTKVRWDSPQGKVMKFVCQGIVPR